MVNGRSKRALVDVVVVGDAIKVMAHVSNRLVRKGRAVERRKILAERVQVLAVALLFRAEVHAAEVGATLAEMEPGPRTAFSCIAAPPGSLPTPLSSRSTAAIGRAVDPGLGSSRAPLVRRGLVLRLLPDIPQRPRPSLRPEARRAVRLAASVHRRRRRRRRNAHEGAAQEAKQRVRMQHAVGSLKAHELGPYALEHEHLLSRVGDGHRLGRHPRGHGGSVAWRAAAESLGRAACALRKGGRRRGRHGGADTPLLLCRGHHLRSHHLRGRRGGGAEGGVGIDVSQKPDLDHRGAKLLVAQPPVDGVERRIDIHHLPLETLEGIALGCPRALGDASQLGELCVGLRFQHCAAHGAVVRVLVKHLAHLRQLRPRRPRRGGTLAMGGPGEVGLEGALGVGRPGPPGADGGAMEREARREARRRALRTGIKQHVKANEGVGRHLVCVSESVGQRVSESVGTSK